MGYGCEFNAAAAGPSGGLKGGASAEREEGKKRCTARVDIEVSLEVDTGMEALRGLDIIGATGMGDGCAGFALAPDLGEKDLSLTACMT